ncbi:outer membrane protein assembly factor BamB [Thauera sp. CAU 1555]|uniref:Outer membrane protein assembly factor BamB n=1 Tax=Thauera sedimentorum TaxID=2767595 RepID=A0ABR9B4V2_9RHOO|nr:outer membrane protein assembly factor BamB [Thauera sedimentorum]MBC9070487.1 outer membrane protein assembly factor BamB [Thauera sedimentorum]MBD8501407.1 outer membrane protein assembly factor BamB [Thauera sedimentorum]
MRAANMRSLLLTVLATVATAGCSSLNPFASSGPKPAELVDIRPSVELRPLWSANVGEAGAYVFQPEVAGDSVYAAAHDGEVARYRDGRPVWSVDLDLPLSAGVGTDGRLVVVVSTAGEAVALDAADGKEHWRVPVGAEVLAQPAVSEEIVVLRSSDNRLIALAPADGARRWVYQRNTPPLALRSFAGIVLESGVALAGFPGGKLVAVSTKNGGELWELTVATPRGATELERVADVAGTPVLGRREICSVTYQGRAGCFDMTNGNVLWSREFSSSVGMDRDARFVFLTDEVDAVHALDAFSGASVWKQDALVRRAVSRPLVIGDFVAVGDFDGYVHLLRREDGRFAARASAGDGAVAADMRRLGDGFVVQTRDGDLQAFEVR